jgi:membrane glycosyltransferase
VQSTDVLAVLLGRDAGWAAQRRAGGAAPASLALRRYAAHTVFGIGLAVCAYLVSPSLAAWMAPVALGLALAVPLVLITSSNRCGMALRRFGLLQTPEETDPPGVVTRAGVLMRRAEDTGPADAIHRLLSDASLLRVHLAMLPPPRRPRRDPLDVALLVGMAKLDEAERFDTALRALNISEKLAVLTQHTAMQRLLTLAWHDRFVVDPQEPVRFGVLDRNS